MEGILPFSGGGMGGSDWHDSSSNKNFRLIHDSRLLSNNWQDLLMDWF